MATQLQDSGEHVVVSTIYGPGTRRKLPRGGVRVLRTDVDLLRAEIERQAKEARADAGVDQA